jgi:protein TonB
MKTTLEMAKRTAAAAILATWFTPPVFAQIPPDSLNKTGEPDIAQRISENQRRIDAIKEEQEQLLARARQQLAAMPRYTPAELARNPQARAQEERRQQLAKALATIERRIQEQNAQPRKVYLSPNTLGATYRPYYLAMCRKIEARGTEHFPQENGRKLYGELMIALLVRHDGRLLETRVLESSGNTTLDRLAEEIAQSSAPFGDFTAEMRKDADQIDITTHFRFVHETARHASTSCGSNAVLAFKADHQN